LGVLHFILLLAQGVPSTDIYVADLRVERGHVTVGAAVNVTARAGYDNQPYFLPDGRAFLYTSIREDGQADVYRYDLRQGASTRVTTTPESEYSPTPLPNGRGGGFSCIRVEADSTQRLWAFDLSGTNPRLVLEAIQPVGYHAWGDDHTLGLFVLGTPATLQVVDTRAGEPQIVARDIGRPVFRVPRRRAISFLQRDSVAGAWIKEVDVRTRAVTPLVRALEGADYFAWTPGGILLAARQTKLYQWDPRRGGEWEEVRDFAADGLTNLSRLAVSPRGDRIAIVAVPK
jgi:WD40 repeat protein